MNDYGVAGKYMIIARWAVDARNKKQWDAFNAYVETLDLLIGTLASSKLLEEAMKTA